MKQSICVQALKDDPLFINDLIASAIEQPNRSQSAKLDEQLSEIERVSLNLPAVQPACAPIKKRAKKQNYIPNLDRRLFLSETIDLKPKNTRLPGTSSISPGPQMYYPESSFHRGPAFSMKGRSNLAEADSFVNVTPQSYNISGSFSSDKAQHEQKWGPRQQLFDIPQGPGAGKYNITDSHSHLSTSQKQARVVFTSDRYANFENFAFVNLKEKVPGSQHYKIVKQDTVQSFTFPKNQQSEFERKLHSMATVNCPNAYKISIASVSRKLYPTVPSPSPHSE